MVSYLYEYAIITRFIIGKKNLLYREAEEGEDKCLFAVRLEGDRSTDNQSM